MYGTSGRHRQIDEFRLNSVMNCSNHITRLFVLLLLLQLLQLLLLLLLLDVTDSVARFSLAHFPRQHIILTLGATGMRRWMSV